MTGRPGPSDPIPQKKTRRSLPNRPVQFTFVVLWLNPDSPLQGDQSTVSIVVATDFRSLSFIFHTV